MFIAAVLTTAFILPASASTEKNKQMNGASFFVNEWEKRTEYSIAVSSLV